MAGRRKLGQILMDAGAITPEQLSMALEDQKRYGGRLGSILLDRRFITEKVFFHALSSQLKIPAIDFSQSTIPEAVIHLLPQEMMEKYIIFPVATRRTPTGNVLVLATSDPTNISVQDEVRFTTDLKVEPILAQESTIKQVIREYFYVQQGKGSYRLQAVDDSVPDENYEIMREEERFGHGISGGQPSPTGDPIQGEASDSQPKLTRELKALLKLLARKGLITQAEYLDEFNDT